MPFSGLSASPDISFSIAFAELGYVLRTVLIWRSNDLKRLSVQTIYRRAAISAIVDLNSMSPAIVQSSAKSSHSARASFSCFFTNKGMGKEEISETRLIDKPLMRRTLSYNSDRHPHSVHAPAQSAWDCLYAAIDSLLYLMNR